MRPSVLLCSGFALGSMATPLLNKRGVVTEYAVVTVTNWVTAAAAELTTASHTSSSSRGHYGSWSGRHSSSTSKVTNTVTSVSVSTPSATTHSSVTSSTRTSSSSRQASSASAAPAPTGTDYNSLVVNHHNVHRANNSANAVVWDQNLANIAATIAAKCVYAHDTSTGGGGYGQNIAAGADSSNIAAIVSDWFHNGEVNSYWDGVTANERNGGQGPDMSTFEKWGHFSQIVWKGTTHVACATHHCTGGLSGVGANVAPYFTVCNYSPPGNYANEYVANVGASLDEPTVTGKTY